MTYLRWTNNRWYAYAESGHGDEAKDQIISIIDADDKQTHRIKFQEASAIETREQLAEKIRQDWRKTASPFDLESLFYALRAFVTDMDEQEATSDFRPI
jgi:hypothetical protein